MTSVCWRPVGLCDFHGLCLTLKPLRIAWSLKSYVERPGKWVATHTNSTCPCAQSAACRSSPVLARIEDPDGRLFTNRSGGEGRPGAPETQPHRNPVIELCLLAFFVQAQVSAVFMVVVDIIGKEPPQMALTEGDEQESRYVCVQDCDAEAT